MQIFQMLVARMPPKQVELTSKHSHCVSISRHRERPLNLWWDPAHSIQVEYINIVEAFLSIVPTEHKKFSANSWHCMACPSCRLLTTYLRNVPHKTRSIEHVEIVEPLISIMASVEINFLPMDGSCMIIAWSRSWTKSFWLVACAVNISHIWLRLRHRWWVVYRWLNKPIQVQNIKVI